MNHHSINKRLKKLEATTTIPSDDCPCRGPWPEFDFGNLTDHELNRLGDLDSKAELDDPLPCSRCGALTITHDHNRLSPAEQDEMRRIDALLIPSDQWRKTNSIEGNCR